MDPEDRRKHLDYIQAVVTRMSAASSTAKGWLLPVVTATYGFALTENEAAIALLGILAVLLFSFLDANYLRQEKAYRTLYNTVAHQTRDVPLFSLNPADATDASDSPARLISRWFPGRTVWLSWSVAPFYGGLALAGLVIVFVAR